MPLKIRPKRPPRPRLCVGTMNDRELLVNRSKTESRSFGSFVPGFLNDGTIAMPRVGRLIARPSDLSVPTALRALRRRLRCELRTGGLHQFDFRSGRCVYCGSKVPRAVRRGESAWLAWVVKNARAIRSRFRSALR